MIKTEITDGEKNMPFLKIYIYILVKSASRLFKRQHSLNDRWDSVSIKLKDVLSASGNIGNNFF